MASTRRKQKFIVGPKGWIFVPDEAAKYGKRKAQPGEVVELTAAQARRYIKLSRLVPYIEDDEDDVDAGDGADGDADTAD